MCTKLPDRITSFTKTKTDLKRASLTENKKSLEVVKRELMNRVTSAATTKIAENEKKTEVDKTMDRRSRITTIKMDSK